MFSCCMIWENTALVNGRWFPVGHADDGFKFLIAGITAIKDQTAQTAYPSSFGGNGLPKPFSLS